jgi:hypothetical protein
MTAGVIERWQVDVGEGVRMTLSPTPSDRERFLELAGREYARRMREMAREIGRLMRETKDPRLGKMVRECQEVATYLEAR